MTRENLNRVLNLNITEDQNGFVASNAKSIAQAYFYPEVAWFRAIYADETVVGFLMLEDNPKEPSYFLWRLMVDERYQGLGFGHRGVELLIDYVKTRPNATKLVTSCVPGDKGPLQFYRMLGFEPTGESFDGEDVMELVF